MAVSSTSTVVSYTGNGSTTSFAVSFPFQGTGSSAEVEVVQRTISTGAESVLSYTTHYTVTGGSGSTGTVVMASAPADTVQIHIRRTTTRTQTVDYTANDPFPADTHELALDRLAMSVQEIEEELDRSFKVSRTNAITTPEFVDDASTRASKLLGFSSNGNILEATTGRVTTVTTSNVAVNGSGASQSATVSFNNVSGALALGIPVGSTGATGPTGDIDDALTTRGDIVIRNASTSVRLAIGAANRVLISDGTDPAYGQVPLATAVSGTLPLANGGTGATSLAGAGVAALASDQTFSAANRGTITVDNDGSLDLNVTNNWKVTPGGNLALTFTNISAGNGQSGNIIFINSGHTITLHANTKGSASLATTLTTAGTYWISYISDGTNVFCTSSAVFV
tara:strand:- start:44 stop:1231 length:1188 start_codon:yes stop_codon:yes gene_type:complete